MNFDKWLQEHAGEGNPEALRRLGIEMATGAPLDVLAAGVALGPDAYATEKRITNDKGGVKGDGNKPDMHLLPPEFLEQTAAVLTFGAKKYEAFNWENVERDRYISALLRHVCREMKDPGGVDPESGMKHTAHIAANIAIIMGLDARKNRFPYHLVNEHGEDVPKLPAGIYFLSHPLTHGGKSIEWNKADAATLGAALRETFGIKTFDPINSDLGFVDNYYKQKREQSESKALAQCREFLKACNGIIFDRYFSTSDGCLKESRWAAEFNIPAYYVRNPGE